MSQASVAITLERTEEASQSDREKAEILCFGATIRELEEGAMQWTKAPLSMHETLFHATCILSDAQEEIQLGNAETARQFINRAKYFVGKGREWARKQEAK